VAVLILAIVLKYGAQLTPTLRVPEAGELERIDIHEHGTPAYQPEFQFMSTTLPGVTAGSGPVPVDPHVPHDGHPAGSISAAITEASPPLTFKRTRRFILLE
jgi:hypothetical protein